MTTKHTPGPWQEDDCRDAYGGTTIRLRDDTPHGNTNAEPIATVYRDEDATLIASTPDLLEALNTIANEPISPADAGSRYNLGVVVKIAQKAIEKAEGTA